MCNEDGRRGFDLQLSRELRLARGKDEIK